MNDRGRFPITTDDLSSFTRYLQAKQSVEDRALNERVWQSLYGWVTSRPAGQLQVLELGAGIGSMLIRFLDSGLFRDVIYTALDRNHELLAIAVQEVLRWAETNAYSVQWIGESDLELTSNAQRIRAKFVPAAIEGYLGDDRAETRWDLVVAHAVLDLLDVPFLLPRIFERLNPGAGYYFPITFDGVTIFEPVLEPQLDEAIYRCYHETMDQRRSGGKPSGESRAGRRLIGQIALAGGKLLEAGSSDWIVFPQNGSYPADEAYFLEYILQTMESALSDSPELNSEQIQRWMARRREQIRAGELVFIAHQIDLFGLR